MSSITIGERYPWASSTPVILRDGWNNPDSYSRKLKQAAHSLELKQTIEHTKATEIIREVRYPYGMWCLEDNFDTNAILPILENAQTQFGLLRLAGLSVPDVDFHIIPRETRTDSIPKVLAKLPIVYGVNLEDLTAQDPTIKADFDQRINRYYSRTGGLTGGLPLQDVSKPEQYIANGPVFTLVDIEPL